MSAGGAGGQTENRDVPVPPGARAVARGRHRPGSESLRADGVALDCLKRAREQAPERADIRHLLGAEYAQIGMHERAEPEFAEALRLEPDRHSARFQFALVQMMRADVPTALQTLAPLLSLPPTDPMQRFGEGLDHLLRDRLEEAAA